MHYRNVTLRIARGPDGPLCEVLDAPLGQDRSAPFEPPFTREDLRELHRRIDDAAGRQLSAARHLHFGGPADAGFPEPSGEDPRVPLRSAARRLSDALFTGPVELQIRRNLATIENRSDRGLRFRIRITPELDQHDLLQDYPSELLLHPDHDTYLALSHRTPVVRYEEVPRDDHPPPRPERLRILAVAPRPSGQKTLNVEGELRSLESTWSASIDRVPRVAVDRLEPPTLQALRRELRRGEVHGLHFMGHARQQSPRTEGELLFETPGGATDAVTSEALVRRIADFVPPLRLIVLNACETARAGAAGTAASLVRAGVPAVVAMQRPVSDRAALAFSRSLYEAIAEGRPVDAAVVEGRLAIEEEIRRSPEWVTPALFLRAPDGELFAPAENEQADHDPPAPPKPGPEDSEGREGSVPWIRAAALSLLVLSAAVAVTLALDGGDRAARFLGMETEEAAGAEDRVSDPSGRADGERSAGGAQPSGTPGAEGGEEPGEGVSGGRPAPVSEADAENDPPADAEATEPVHDSRNPPTPRTLEAGRSTHLPELGLTVRADFLDLEGEEFVRIVLAPDDGRVVRLPVVGPQTLEVEASGRTVTLQVLGIDWGARTVEIRP